MSIQGRRKVPRCGFLVVNAIVLGALLVVQILQENKWTIGPLQLKFKAAQNVDEGEEIESTPASGSSTGTPWQGACSLFFPSSSSSSSSRSTEGAVPSSSAVWKSLKSRILDATYTHPSDNSSTNERYRRWIDEIFEHHTVDILRRSAIQPSNPDTARRLLEVLSDILLVQQQEQQNQGTRKTTPRVDETLSATNNSKKNTNETWTTDGDGDGDDNNKEQNRGTLRILVLGGSVCMGLNCLANTIGLGVVNWRRPVQPCAWPARLEHILNQVFFDGSPVVRIANLCTGGTSTEIGKYVLEYNLFPDEMVEPHIVVSDYAPNDAQDPDPDALFYSHMQDFVRAAGNLRRCDDDLPLVMLTNTFYRSNHRSGHVQQKFRVSGDIYKTASWYDLMAVDHANVLQHELMRRYRNDSVGEPLLGSNIQVHNGMGYHISVAWTMLFNLLTAFVDACGEMTEKGDDPAVPSSTNDPQNSTLDHLNDETATTRLRTKDIGRLAGESTWESSIVEWKNNTGRRRSICGRMDENGGDGAPKRACTYAWMISNMAGSSTQGDLHNHLRGVLKASDGWQVHGRPIRQPRIGWYALSPNATFQLDVRATMETKHLTVISMKSYGDHFRGSKLLVAIDVVRRAGEEDHNDDEDRGTGPAQASSFEIDGYHEIRTSVHFPHKLPIPRGGANSGDSIRVNFTLIGGSYFKINGLAFCAH